MCPTGIKPGSMRYVEPPEPLGSQKVIISGEREVDQSPAEQSQEGNAQLKQTEKKIKPFLMREKTNDSFL